MSEIKWSSARLKSNVRIQKYSVAQKLLIKTQKLNQKIIRKPFSLQSDLKEDTEVASWSPSCRQQIGCQCNVIKTLFLCFFFVLLLHFVQC